MTTEAMKVLAAFATAGDAWCDARMAGRTEDEEFARRAIVAALIDAKDLLAKTARKQAETEAAKEAADDARRRWLLRPLTSCAADDDGDCNHHECPQIRDGEPKRTGRHCPLDRRGDDES